MTKGLQQNYVGLFAALYVHAITKAILRAYNAHDHRAGSTTS